MSAAFITIRLSSETPDAAFTSHLNLTENPMTARRQFIQWIPAAGLALMAARSAQAEMVGDKDANAVALGYVADATKADKAKFKTYAAGQKCSNCQLYQGKAPCRHASPCGGSGSDDRPDPTDETQPGSTGHYVETP